MPGQPPLSVTVLVAITAVALLAGAVPAGAVGNGSGGSTEARIVKGPDDMLLPVVGQFAGSTVVSSTCGREVVYEDGVPVDAASPIDVVLDAGHGGPESGSVGANGLVERDLNLIVAFHTKLALEEMGHTVALTRRRDLHMPIRQRTAIARALDPRAFVSIHHNGGAVKRSEMPGTEVFHQIDVPESQRLAGLLFEEVQAVFTGYWVPWVSTYHQGVSARLREPRTDTYGVLRMTRGIPSAIVEGLYLSNPPEAQLLALPEIQQAEGKAIATAIDRFLTTEDPGSGFKAEFYDPHTTGTGTARGCEDITYTEPVEITTGFTAAEHADLLATARSMGRPVDWLIRFGVYTLKFLGDLPGAATIVPLAEEDRPDAYGPVTESVTWDQAEQVVLVRMAEAYGLTRTEVQKLATSLMVFLANLPSTQDPA
ncbi:MAG: N-acetylmuramoyl-L-alanine amidase [Acidimicrobiales bacterium]|jgi:N-acetylmuramoyl-L-alanine amidase|nr:N-acetylmuramoyl-L-alanine amidase [Acidimicrobiales bacterium]MDP6910888.1 N-acetylmuramoyl-L-alanine amidase [Acidimicrobiales bacterium]HJP25225.1 N-acetylmuramoyl-L-alanine amidase [Acidimicrobiales bacterium]